MGARLLFTGRYDEGVSAPPYDRANLADHVGDAPAAVAANRAALAHRVGVPPERLVVMSQVHGRDVAVVDAPRPAPVPRVDALLTATPGLALMVLVADCVPLLLAAATPAGGLVAAVHAGRRGVELGVVPAVLRRVRQLGGREVRAELGPSICGACYEVGADVQAAVTAVLPEASARTSRGTAALDLRAGVAAQLRAAGVTDITSDAPCTAEDPGSFSYRRDGVTGRGAGVVVLEE